MMSIMLICNAGMSTGLLAKRIEKASGYTLMVEAYGEAEYPDHLAGVDLILVGPQIRHLIPQIQTMCQVPVRAIAPHYYGVLDGAGVYKDIQNILREEKV